MAEHRVPVLGAALHRRTDPSRSSDPRIRELVTALATLEVAPPPRAHFRAELRSQLVAVAPRLVSEGPAELVRHAPETVDAAQPSRARTVASRLPRLRIGRPVRFVVAALTVLALALSGAVWLSRSALPGETLYGLKRASENAQFSLTSGNVPRGKELLSFAKTRVDEVTDLLSKTTASGVGIQAGGAIDSHTAALVTSTLNSADGDVRQASQLFGSQAVHDRSASPLTVMINWAPAQMSRLGTVVSRTPTGSIRDRVMSSAKLLSAAYTRAQALKSVLGCSCLGDAPTDSLGPVPCRVCSTSTARQHPNQPGNPGSANNPNRPGSGPNPSGSARNRTSTGASNPRGPTGAPTPAPTASPTPGGPLPTAVLPTLPLPSTLLPLPSLPLPSTPPGSAGSCDGLTLGPIGIGTCGIHLHI
ncbi:MAG: DUF5667 domain-containing protein [Jatrophihabitantaceae bacterium]